MPRPKKATPETLAERQRRNRESYHRCKNNIKALNAEVDVVYQPDPKHLCPKCGKQMTRNKYACGTCLDLAERHYDVDAICKWGSGLAIHRRGMGTVCRVGGSAI
jgi:hypothetical protein